MGSASNVWFSTVYQTWLGTPMSQSTWEGFLSDSDVQKLAANDTTDYQRLYLQKFISTSFSQDSVVQALTQEAFPGASTEQTQVLIQMFFAQSQVLSLPATASKQDYYSLYWQFLSRTVLLSDPNVSQWFLNTTEQLFGSVSVDQFEQILSDFFATSSVQSLPSTASLSDYQRLYVQYLSSTVNQTHIAEQVLGQSPEAVQQYKILWAVFELLAKMLSEMTISQIRNAVAVQFLTEKRSIGATAYTEAPVYIGSGNVSLSLINELDKYFKPPNKSNLYFVSSVDSVYTPINVDTNDPSKFTLGYANISLQNVSDWLYSQYKANPTTANSFSLYSGDYVLSNSGGTTFGTQKLTLGVQNVNGSPVITASLIQYQVKSPQFISEDGTVDWDKELAQSPCPVTTTTVISPVTINPTASDQTSVENALNSAFTQLWETGTTEGYIQPTADNNHLTSFEKSQSSEMQDYSLHARTPMIAYAPGILSSGFNPGDNPGLGQPATYLSNLVNQRALENQNVSSQIMALTARMDVLKSLTSQQSQVESASTSEVQMTCNIMQATITTMQQILSTFFV